MGREGDSMEPKSHQLAAIQTLMLLPICIVLQLYSRKEKRSHDNLQTCLSIATTLILILLFGSKKMH